MAATSTKREPPPGREEAPEGRAARRVQMRRRGMAFSGGGLSNSSSGGAPVEANPENDHPDLNAAVRARAVRPAPVSTEEVPAPAERTDPMATDRENLNSISNRADFTPQGRLAQVGRRSSEYEREYRLGLLSRLLMRNIPLDEIAAQLGVSLSTVNRDKAELAERFRDAARKLNIEEMVGNNMEFYGEVRAMSMRAASANNQPMPMRLAAMRTALASQNDMHRFLQAAGVYDTLRFRKAPGESGQGDIQRMLAVIDDLVTESNRDRRQEGGSDPLGDFSGGDTERADL